MCKKKDEKHRLGGSAVSVYPNRLSDRAPTRSRPSGQKKINHLMRRTLKDGVLWLDFVCYVPKDYEPVAVGLKANAIAEVPPMVAADQA